MKIKPNSDLQKVAIWHSASTSQERRMRLGNNKESRRKARNKRKARER